MDILRKDVDIFKHLLIFFNISSSLKLVDKSLSRLKTLSVEWRISFEFVRELFVNTGNRPWYPAKPSDHQDGQCVVKYAVLCQVNPNQVWDNKMRPGPGQNLKI